MKIRKPKIYSTNNGKRWDERQQQHQQQQKHENIHRTMWKCKTMWRRRQCYLRSDTMLLFYVCHGFSTLLAAVNYLPSRFVDFCVQLNWEKISWVQWRSMTAPITCFVLHTYTDTNKKKEKCTKRTISTEVCVRSPTMERFCHSQIECTKREKRDQIRKAQDN